MKTYHDGANEERSAILDKVRRMMKVKVTALGSGYTALVMVENFLLKRNERYDARKGGLGKT